MAAKTNKKENIQVYLRVRPLNSPEKKQKSVSVVDVVNKKEVRVRDVMGHSPDKYFTFDRVFGPDSKQLEVYKEVLHQVIDEVLAGYNCTVFAYGQTGSGKTFTMEGERSQDASLSWEQDPLCGIIPRCFNQLFDEMCLKRLDHTVRVSFLEIYNEELIDLLSSPTDSTKLKLFDDSTKKGSVIVSGLEEKTVNSKSEIYNILERGAAKRQTASTLMNAHSSRSHTIFTITVHVREVVEDEEFIRIGKLNLVDLAGSENIGRSGAVDKRAREAGNINQSLLTLGRVITSLVDLRPHIPYRESKLTRMLQDSLGGRTKTSIIATVSPAAVNFDETQSTLNYATRAKNIVNKPEINEKKTQGVILKEYIDEIDRLRRDLKAARNKEGIVISEENYNEMVLKLKSNDQEMTEKINRLRAMEEERDRLECVIQELKENTKEAKILLEEEKFVVEEISKMEKILLSRAKEVQNVAGQAASHVHLLHDKIIRKDTIEQHNKEASMRFYEQFGQSLQKVHNEIEGYIDYQISHLLKLKKEIAKSVKKSEKSLGMLKTGLRNISDKTKEINFKEIKDSVGKNENDIEGFIDAFLTTVVDDEASKITATESIESVILPELSDMSTYMNILKEESQENESVLNEHFSDMDRLIKNNEQMYCNEDKSIDSLSRGISGLSNLGNLKTEALKKQLDHCTETVERLNDSNSAYKNSRDQQLNELSEIMNSQEDLLKQLCENREQGLKDTNSQYAALENAFDDFSQSMESQFSAVSNMINEQKLNFEVLCNKTLRGYNSRNATCSSSLEEPSRDITMKFNAVSSNLKESGQSLISSIAGNIHAHSKQHLEQLLLKKQQVSTFSNSLQGNCQQIEISLHNYIHCDNSSEGEMLNYEPTGHTPSRRLTAPDRSGNHHLLSPVPGASSSTNTDENNGHTPSGKENESVSPSGNKTQSKLKPPKIISKRILTEKN